MNITEHFTFEELTKTNTGLSNIPGPKEFEALSYLAVNLLEPLRQLYGKPITVNSAFRSREVNRAVGGSETSQHCKGEAADLTCDDNKKLFELIRDNFIFDQLINEKNYSWIHVSLKKNGNRKQVLRYINGRYELV